MLDKSKLRSGYSTFIDSLAISKMLTVTFKYKFSDNDCLSYLNTAIHFSNTYLYGYSYSKRKMKYLKGIIVLEHHASGMPHFHILLINDDAVSTDTFATRIQRAFSKVRYYGHNRRYRVFDSVGIDVRKAETDTGKLSWYLTKENMNGSFDNIGILSSDKISYNFT